MIDLKNYRLVLPTSVKTVHKNEEMYDIVVEDDHTFFVHLSDSIELLTHNCDGEHITSLLINFFYKWFPDVIKGGHLYKLITPLVVCDYKNSKKYFYSLEDFVAFTKDKKVSNVNYLKGLGSLSLEDWKFVMDNKTFFKILNDKSSNKFLEIAFGDNSKERKKWLST